MTGRSALLATAAAAAVGLLFGLYPELDLAISARFFDPAENAFPLRSTAWIRHTRDLAQIILIALSLPAVIALVLKLLLPHRPMLIAGRAAVFLIVTLILGPGLLVNALLKEHWPRPRPVAVSEFGGRQQFTAWWDPRGDCPRNCSFVSGEGSSAFWTIAPAIVTPPAWRATAVAAAVVYAATLSSLRLAVGAHFFTDLVFAAFFTFLIIWIVYRWLYRGSAGPVDPVETGIERLRRLGRPDSPG